MSTSPAVIQNQELALPAELGRIKHPAHHEATLRHTYPIPRTRRDKDFHRPQAATFLRGSLLLQLRRPVHD
jgi:hypothetical protein